MKLCTILYALFLLSFTANAQVSINTNGAAPSSTSMLDVQSSNRGVKFPRMTSAQRKAIPVTQVDAGLMVYDTNESVLFMYDGEQWLPFAVASGKQQQLKEKFSTAISSNAKMGGSVSMSNDLAAIGCSQDSVNGLQNAGSVLIYKKMNDTWVEQAKIVSPEVHFEYFGCSVSLLNNVLAVGAFYGEVAGIAQGVVYIYVNNNGNWTFQQKIYANDGASGNQFGFSVLLHLNSLYVGSINHTVSKSGQGSVYVFEKSGNTFIPLTRLNGSEPGTGDGFGHRIAAHNNTIVVGAPYYNYTLSDEGAAYIFVRSGNSFTQQAKLKSPGAAAAAAYFGRTVAIYNDWVFIGVPFGSYQAGYTTGLVHTYKRTGTTWNSAFTIRPDVTDPGDKGFGAAIAILNEKDFIITAPFESVNGLLHKGAVYVYKLNDLGTSEVFRYRFFNNDPFPYTGTGASIASNGSDILVGSPGASFVSRAGSLFFGVLQ